MQMATLDGENYSFFGWGTVPTLSDRVLKTSHFVILAFTAIKTLCLAI